MQTEQEADKEETAPGVLPDRVRIKLTLAYVGTHYHGWQIQARPDGPLLTVQGLLEQAAARVADTPVHVHGAGRTDAGVHAEGQVAHMDIPAGRTGVDWQLALNTLLPHDIRVVRAERAPEGFHAQFGAKRKRYLYRLWLSLRYTPPRLYPFVWSCGSLDVDRMLEAAQHLEGRQDFSSLKNSGTDLLSSVRTVYAVRCLSAGAHGRCEGERELVWSFEADGFLKQMVRNSMGLLVAAGRGKLSPDDIPAILAARDRRKAGPTAPAQGLTLDSITYV
ncbi:MAG TPA: tRNA pseudouridine(38-40) synthase TruA [Candidatus Avidesulfovibrio excrementigallinarum]|nr:tRNA pseudouridine(38-40) synthase TruA [Candidatus Avidesulfovibrio excrementigallinarum]